MPRPADLARARRAVNMPGTRPALLEGRAVSISLYLRAEDRARLDSHVCPERPNRSAVIRWLLDTRTEQEGRR